jgi:hypothetical protein
MALDAGTHLYIVPDPTAASATPAAANLITFVGAAVKGGFLVTEDMDLEEAGAVYAVAATSAVVFKLQVCRDTQLANAADILGVPVGSAAASASATAPAATTAIGSTLVKRYNFRLRKGDFVLFNVTTGAAGAGQGYFYAKCYPAGEPVLGTKLQGSTVVSTFASST